MECDKFSSCNHNLEDDPINLMHIHMYGSKICAMHIYMYGTEMYAM